MDNLQDAPLWVQILSGALGLLMAWLAPKLNKMLSDKADELAARSKIPQFAMLDEFLVGFVALVGEKGFKDELLKALADGKVTPEERKKLIGILVEAAKKHFGLKNLAKLFGGAANVDEALESRAALALAGLGK